MPNAHWALPVFIPFLRAKSQMGQKQIVQAKNRIKTTNRTKTI